MQIPKSVRIGPYRYRIRRQNGLAELASCYGQCDSRKQEIILDADIDGARLADTLIHECLHAASDVYALGLTEQQVSVLATALSGSGLMMR